MHDPILYESSQLAPRAEPRPLIASLHLVIMALLAQGFCLAYYWLAKPTIWVGEDINPNTLFREGCLIISWVCTALFNIRTSALTKTPWLRLVQLALLVALAVTVVFTVFRSPI
jgi:hypothetical protein